MHSIDAEQQIALTKGCMWYVECAQPCWTCPYAEQLRKEGRTSTLKLFSAARFYFIPDYVVDPAGQKVFVSSEKLREAYGVSLEQVAKSQDDSVHALWLGPRQSGDYKEHLELRLKARGFAGPSTEQPVPRSGLEF